MDFNIKKVLATSARAVLALLLLTCGTQTIEAQDNTKTFSVCALNVDGSPTLYLRSETDIKVLEDIIAEIGRITTGVSTVMGNKNARVTDIYTIDGKRIPALRHGVNIVRMSDGTVKKVVK